MKNYVKQLLQTLLGGEEMVDYVCGNNEALPLPLSAEEEREMLEKMGREM